MTEVYITRETILALVRQQVGTLRLPENIADDAITILGNEGYGDFRPLGTGSETLCVRWSLP